MRRFIILMILIVSSHCLKNLNHPLDITKPSGLLLNCVLYPNIYDFCYFTSMNSIQSLRGVLDVSFGNNGILYINLPELPTQPIFPIFGNLVVDSNQNILLVGSRNEKLMVSRLNSNGSFDTTFGVEGIWEHDIPTSNKEGLIDVTITSDNKILSGGVSFTSGSNVDIVLLRMNSDGALLNLVNPSSIQREILTSIAIQTLGSEERYLVGGFHSDNNVFIRRYKDSVGTLLLDTSFNNPLGYVDLDINVGSTDILSTLKVREDGKIMFGGRVGLFPSEMFLARYQANGNGYDTSFNGSGKVITSFGGSNFILDIKILSDNKILVVGEKQGKLYMARYNENGSIDTTFGINGEIVEDINGTFSRIQLTSDGKIIAGGSVNASDSQIIIVCYNPDGTKDTSFGNNGIFTYNYSTSSYPEELQGLAIQFDAGKEKIIVGATIKLSSSPYDQDIYIIRIE